MKIFDVQEERAVSFLLDCRLDNHDILHAHLIPSNLCVSTLMVSQARPGLPIVVVEEVPEVDENASVPAMLELAARIRHPRQH